MLKAQEEWIRETALTPGRENNRSKSRHRSIERCPKKGQEWNDDEWERGRPTKKVQKGTMRRIKNQ